MQKVSSSKLLPLHININSICLQYSFNHLLFIHVLILDKNAEGVEVVLFKFYVKAVELDVI